MAAAMLRAESKQEADQREYDKGDEDDSRKVSGMNFHGLGKT